jgi:pyroglutamyl-peptidase
MSVARSPVKRSRADRKVLVTGFEPFAGETENPSALVAQALEGRAIRGRTVVSAVLPCVFGEANDALRTHLRRENPELVICVGQAGGRASVAIERVAVNVMDARIADNAGARPIDLPVALDGPVAYWSSLPIKAIVAAIREDGLPADISESAGTFVCNAVFYGLMRWLARRPNVRGGFVHIPFSPEQAQRMAGKPASLAIAQSARAVEIAIATALARRLRT